MKHTTQSKTLKTKRPAKIVVTRQAEKNRKAKDLHDLEKDVHDYCTRPTSPFYPVPPYALEMQCTSPVYQPIDEDENSEIEESEEDC